MSKASSVVASVTQQSRQRVLQSRTEYRERPNVHCYLFAMVLSDASVLFIGVREATECLCHAESLVVQSC